MLKTAPFETHAAEYEQWFDQYKFVFESEVEAIREMLPPGNSRGIEVGLGTGRFATALGIHEGVEPALAMRRIAIERGIEVMNAQAEELPYKDLHFDFVLITSCISYVEDVRAAFNEANRVLKPGGSLIVGFIEKNSLIGKFYEQKRQDSIFYKQATFYSVDKVVSELKQAGFKQFVYSQTLFESLDEIKSFEPAIEGYDKGSFVLIKAIKK